MDDKDRDKYKDNDKDRDKDRDKNRNKDKYKWCGVTGHSGVQRLGKGGTTPDG